MRYSPRLNITGRASCPECSEEIVWNPNEIAESITCPQCASSFDADVLCATDSAVCAFDCPECSQPLVFQAGYNGHSMHCYECNALIDLKEGLIDLYQETPASEAYQEPPVSEEEEDSSISFADLLKDPLIALILVFAVLGVGFICFTWTSVTNGGSLLLAGGLYSCLWGIWAAAGSRVTVHPEGQVARTYQRDRAPIRFWFHVLRALVLPVIIILWIAGGATDFLTHKAAAVVIGKFHSISILEFKDNVFRYNGAHRFEYNHSRITKDFATLEEAKHSAQLDLEIEEEHTPGVREMAVIKRGDVRIHIGGRFQRTEDPHYFFDYRDYL